jgi:hypothetical protein
MAQILDLAEYKTLRGIDTTDRDPQISAALPIVEDAISRYAERDFTADPVTETRRYRYEGPIVNIDDAIDVEEVEIDGVLLSPDDNYTVEPYDRSQAYYFLDLSAYSGRRASPLMGFTRNEDVLGTRQNRFVDVTAEWGWGHRPGGAQARRRADGGRVRQPAHGAHRDLRGGRRRHQRRLRSAGTRHQSARAAARGGAARGPLPEDRALMEENVGLTMHVQWRDPLGRFAKQIEEGATDAADDIAKEGARLSAKYAPKGRTRRLAGAIFAVKGVRGAGAVGRGRRRQAADDRGLPGGRLASAYHRVPRRRPAREQGPPRRQRPEGLLRQVRPGPAPRY